MTPTDTHQPGMTWLVFALMTVAAWGLYGIFLHSGQVGMADPAQGRYKAFLFVGLAYFLTAVLAPLAILVMNGASWKFPVAGMGWSLFAGVVGAIGAFCVLLAFGANGQPSVVMTIVFGGAPVVNAVVALLMNPPEGGFVAVPKPFYLGLLLAVAGGCLVTFFKPAPAKHKPVPVVIQSPKE